MITQSPLSSIFESKGEVGGGKDLKVYLIGLVSSTKSTSKYKQPFSQNSTAVFKAFRQFLPTASDLHCFA